MTNCCFLVFCYYAFVNFLEEYAVELKTGGKAMESPLNVALKHGCPEDIIDIVAERYLCLLFV